MLLERINTRLRLMLELAQEARPFWMSPSDPRYSRMDAENSLFYTVGPLTDSPRWAKDWTTPDGRTHQKGDPAPQWTQHEIVIAMAGDPEFLFTIPRNPEDSARSPSAGGLDGLGRPKSGAPIYRLAKKVARKYARERDRQFVADLYNNGLLELTKLMQPGYDESREPFISWVIRNIEGAMEHGVGSNMASLRAVGARSQEAVGLEGLLEVKTGDEARELASQVKGRFQTTKSHEKSPENPFGPYSSRYYQLAMQYADALDSGQEERIEATRNQIMQLQDQVRDETESIPGASSGLGQAISIKDRQSHVGISSIDAPKKGGEEEAGMAGNIADYRAGKSWIDPETIHHILRDALTYNFEKVLGPNSKFIQMVGGKVGGPFTANEYRYVLRYLGPIAADYPGKDRMRAALDIPRDTPPTASKQWWRPGEDPEIEPNPRGGIWQSLWRREGCQQMGPQSIATEMTREYSEFRQLGIATARKPNVKVKNGQRVIEVVGKEGVNLTFNKALVKLKVAATANKGALGMDENKKLREAGFTLTEDLDSVDRAILESAADWLISWCDRQLALLSL